MRIKKKKNEEEVHTENGEDDAQEQEADETVRLPSLSQAHLKELQSYRSLKNDGRTEQTYKSSSLVQDVEAPAFKGVVGMKPISDAVPESPLVSNNNAVVTRSTSDAWGWLPVLSLTSAIGVFLVALAYEAGRVASPWGDVLVWVGLLVFFLPITWRLFSSRPARRERIALLIVSGIALYFVKFLQYPLYFTYFDEFTHWRTTHDIIASGHLFHENPILLISPWYPGLEIVTSALSSLTGLSIFGSGIVLIGVARLVLVLALYLFFEQFTNSARAAGIATVLYMANSNLLYFDADFSYESFALPLAAFVLFAVALRCYGPAGRHRGLTLAICLGLGAVVITHHVTSYALEAFLLLWTVVFFYQSRAQKDQARPGPGGVALLGLVLIIVWLQFTGDLATGYLGQYLGAAVPQLVQILAGERAPRQLFQNASGFVVPLWERIISSTSVALIMLGLPFGFFRVWRHHRANAAALALAIGALVYPISQVFRLTAAGGEAGNRATAFVFLGIAFVLTIGVTEFWLSRTQSWRRSASVIGAVSIICFGQFILGTGTFPPVPGPYAVSADARSIEPEGMDAAKWAGSYLGPGHRIATDRVNMLLMETYGNEWIVTVSNSRFSVAPVFTLPQIGPTVEVILQQDNVQYLVVDRRLSTSLPLVGTYFDQPPAPGEPGNTRPIDPAALAKFDGVKNMSRIFDSGDIVIYDVEAITSVTSTAPTPRPSCPPAPRTAVSLSYPKIAKLYAGTIYDIPTGLTANISLAGIQQQQGAICGNFIEEPENNLFSQMPTNGPFNGTIATDKQIQFILTSDTGRATFSFDGAIQPGGTIAGTYCNLEVASGKCSDYGLWSVSPVT